MALAGPEIQFILEDGGCKAIFVDMEVSDHVLSAFTQEDSQLNNLPKTMIWMNVDGKERKTTEFIVEGISFVMYEDCASHTRDHETLLAYRQQVKEEGSAEDAYHCYYTSGTTGHPKPVRLSHNIVVRHAVATIKGEWLVMVVILHLLEYAAFFQNRWKFVECLVIGWNLHCTIIVAHALM